MRTIRSFVEIGALVLASLGGAGAATTNVAFGGVGSTFRPSAITIHAGDTVVWTNAGGFHTVTSTSAEALCGNVPASCSHTFTNAGTHPYFCSFHQFLGMTGVVFVVSAPPSPAVLTNATRLTNGQFKFTVMSTANRTNVVQASTNLNSTNNWVPIATLVPNTNRFDFTDTSASGFGIRLYRVVQP